MKIGIIGSGNVADVLARSLFKAGYIISFIASRNRIKGRKIASSVKAAFIPGVSSSLPASDLIIIAVNDSAIASVVKELKDTGSFVVHTSGATPLSALEKFNSNGVLYPVNSLKSGSNLDEGTFFCIEANNKKLLAALKKISGSIQCKSLLADSEQRLAVHVSAVFANNFVNACFQSAFDILEKKKIPFSVLKPLLISTIQKALAGEPRLNQTGPAMRNDSATLKKHNQFLKNEKELRGIYKALSALIVNQQKKK